MTENFFATFEEVFDKQSGRYFSELSDFLSIQSISTDPSFHQQALGAAQWLVEHLKQMGGSVELLPTDHLVQNGLPAVNATFQASKQPENARTVLFYGHYDVQPVDPLELWETEPFKPTEKNGRLYARGAQDNKGQLFYFLKALEESIKLGSLKYNVKVLIEGQEECGSEGITKLLPSISSKLTADILLVCDTGTLDASLGAITMGLRGVLHLEFKLIGPKKDLHSGVHGGLVKNPATEICRLISKIHDDVGAIAIPDFYSGVAELSSADREKALRFPMTDIQYKQMVGVLPTGGEQGLPAPIRRGLRPTVEINGITSGYQGEGSKTIIPSWASAKISCRIVKGQSSVQTVEKVVNFLQKNVPADLKFEVAYADASGEGFACSIESAPIKKAAELLEKLTGKEPLYIWEGASIPLIPALIESSGALPLLVGFGLEDDNIHAPNESFSLDQWKKGFLFCSALLSN